jgi:hypothetical protein
MPVAICAGAVAQTNAPQIAITSMTAQKVITDPERFSGSVRVHRSSIRLTQVAPAVAQ